MKVSTVEAMRELDRSAIQELGISEELLMENAGEAAYFAILKEFGAAGKSFLVFCGAGNNGGDGLVVARKLHSMGAGIKIYLMGQEDKLRGAARKNLEIVHRLGLPLEPAPSPEELRDQILHCDAVVDALFGTGLDRAVEGAYRDLIQAINRGGKKVFSLDIPSGINGNTGQVMGIAAKAHCTITFGLPKLGNLLYPGYEYGGKLYVSHISFPPSLYGRDSLLTEINQPVSLPPRDRNAHKGDFGDVLFIAGAANYYGAPYFCAHSFLKAGGGYARLAAPASVTPVVAARGQEIVFHPQEETPAGSLALRNRERLLELSEGVDMVVLGPGLSLHEETQELARNLIGPIPKPLLIDGDGLSALATDPGLLKQRREATVLTPHPGELSRLVGQPIKAIEDQRVESARQAAAALNATVVLKGAHSLIAQAGGKVFINLSGNSGMATAGSGDVLAGTIAAAFGLGLPLDEAVQTGVFLHGVSGDLAAADMGEDGLTAQDLVDYLPRTCKSYREAFSHLTGGYYQRLQQI